MFQPNEEAKVKKALIKKAVGYTVNEVVEEYVLDENGNEILSKRKVLKKHIAPDINAIRVMLSEYGNFNDDEISSMTDEQLLEERDRLIAEIKQENKKQD